MYDVTGRIDRTDDGVRTVCTVHLPVATAVVFDAVATGEGISSWFVPCALEPRVGGRVVQFADPGAPDPTSGPEAAVEASLTATVGEITDYRPPGPDGLAHFSYVESNWMGEGVPVPPWSTTFDIRPEIRPDARPDAPGTLLTLTSGFSQGGQLVDNAVAESVVGWTDALTVLAHRLTHRPESGVVTVLAATEASRDSVTALWSRAADRLSITAGDAPVARFGDVGGVVLSATEAAATVVLSAPVDGVAQLFAFPAGDSATAAADHAALAVRVYEYVDRPGGDGSPLGAAAVDDVEPGWDSGRWRDWLDDLVAR